MELKTAQSFLLQNNFTTAQAIENAKEQIRSGKYPEEESVPSVLFQEHEITETQYIQSLSAEYQMESVDLSQVDIAPKLKNMIQKPIAQKYCLIPIMEDGKSLYIALNDPTNYTALQDVKKITGRRIVPLISSKMTIEQKIMEFYGMDRATRAIDSMARTVSDDYNDDFVANLDDSKDDASAAEKLVNTILEQALVDHASDIHFEPHMDHAVVRLRVDGMLRNAFEIPKNLYRTVVSRIKVMGEMDTSKRTIPQDGRYAFRLHDQEIDLRISSIPTVMGEKVVTRLLNKSEGTLDKNAIGLQKDDFEKYDKLLSNHNGVILMVGPTGSGKSSTMYTMIKVLNKPNVNIMSLEDPVEYNIDGVNQIQINNKVDMTFANGLRAAMRQDPDIIGIGEIRDGETADIAMRAAITGHLVISTLHTNDAVSSIARLADVGVEPYLISNALLGVISQRLVRKICTNCKEEYTPSSEELSALRSMGFDTNQHFYHGCGCSLCHNTGYSGRTGVFEIMVMNSEIREAVTNGATYSQLYQLALKGGMVPLRANCMKLVEQGVTTIDEMKRIINTID